MEPLRYIPDRYKEGYGLSIDAIKKAKQESVKVLIVADCGIKAIEQIELANSFGIRVIICDHHKPSTELPKADAILNPKQIDCEYPYKELCGCGIVFKLIQAVNHKKGKTIDELQEFIDLVAIAIAADIVPIDGENRILAYFGLEQINKAPRKSLKPFLKNINRNINISDLAFRIGPRINAAGRIKHAKHALELLICNNDIDIKAKARSIELLNSERKLIDEKTTKEAIDQIDTLSKPDEKTTVVFLSLIHI